LLRSILVTWLAILVALLVTLLTMLLLSTESTAEPLASHRTVLSWLAVLARLPLVALSVIRWLVVSERVVVVAGLVVLVLPLVLVLVLVLTLTLVVLPRQILVDIDTGLWRSVRK
jgi:hypothetical protein